MELHLGQGKIKKRTTFSVLLRMAVREIKKSWAQFLAIIAIGAIAVTLFVGLIANAEVFDNQLNATYDAGNMADIWVYSLRYNEEDEAQVRSYLRNGDEMDDRFMYTATANGKAVYLNVYDTYPTVSHPYNVIYRWGYGYDEVDFALIDLSMAGDRFPSGQKMELSLDISSLGMKSQATALSLLVDTENGGRNVLAGDSLDLYVPVTGYMCHSESIERSQNASVSIAVSDHLFATAFDELIRANYGDNADLVYILLSLGFEQMGWNPDFAGNLDPETYVPLTRPNQYLIALEDDARADDLSEAIDTYFTSHQSTAEDGSRNNYYMSCFTRSTHPFCLTMSSDLRQAYQLATFIPVVFFSVAILVILTTISAIIVKDRTQIGTLKAVGVSTSGIYGYYISMTLALVFIGAMLGEIIGPLIIPWIMQIKYSMLYRLVPFSFAIPWLYAILTLVVFLGVSALVTYLITRQEVGPLPSESMRPAAPKFMGRGATRKSKIKQNVPLLSLKMALRNIKVSAFKSTMVVVGVTGCTALLVCGYGIEDTISHSVDLDLSTYITNDVSLNFTTSQSSSSIERHLEPILDLLDTSENGEPRYQGVSRSSSTVSNIDGRSYNSYYCLLEPREESFVNISFDHDGVAISRKVQEAIGVGEGDTIEFTAGARRYTAEVKLVFDAFTFHGVVYYGDAPFLTSTPYYPGVYLKAAEGISETELGERCEELISVVSTWTSQAKTVNYINNVMSAATQMTGAIKVFAILLAVVVLYNLALLNFRERQRDIATLKVLGFSTYEIALSILFETMLLTLLGVVFGLLLGWPFMYAVLVTNQIAIAQFIYYISPVTYVIAFLLTFVVAFVINLIFAMRSRKVRMVDSLKSVE